MERVRVLDPACGSGALLVSALERLAALRAALGDGRPVADVRRAVLAGSIFGVDVNPTAVWLCELRLWLSVSLDVDAADPRRVPPLPNLDHNVRVGDSLAGGRFDAEVAPGHGVGRALAARRERYVRASGARKRTLGRALEREERTRALALLDARLARLAAARRELAMAARARDLFGARRGATPAERARMAALRAESRTLAASRRVLAARGPLPFAFATHFPEAAAAGGFDVVVANPPWVRPHHAGAGVHRSALRDAFRSFREAAWEPGAARAGAGRGFAGQVDLAAPFVEQALALARPGGVASLLVPAKLWRSLAGGGVRRVVMEEARVLALADLSDASDGFEAATYPSLLVARRRERADVADDARTPPRTLAASLHRRATASRWTMPVDALPYDASPGSPWLLLPADARTAFERVRSAGEPLGTVLPTRPTLGVKCGCNEAFVVRAAGEGAGGTSETIAIRSGERVGLVERSLLRPLVRGETLAPWRTAPPAPERELIVWTHGADGTPLAELPPCAARWLAPWRRRLARRADARGAVPWWALFRVEGARADRARVVWADIGRSPRAAVLLPGDRTVALNSCYVARCGGTEDALALAALLNGPVVAAWLDALAEPARGGYRRYLGWTMSLLPVPRDWPRARRLLAPLAERGWRGDPPRPDELTAAALDAFGLARRDVAPLLEWTGR